MSRSTVPISVATTFRSKDEQAWERQQRRKRRTAPEVKIPATGPCCGRCHHWRAPDDGDAFGDCRRLLVIVSGRDKGIVFTEEEDRDLIGMDEPLNSKAGYQCSQFAPQTESLTEETFR